MSQSNYITLALFAVIGLVFLIDYLKKRKENSIEKSVEKFIEKESKNKVLFFLDVFIITLIICIFYLFIMMLIDPPDRGLFYYNVYGSYTHLDRFRDFIILYSWIPGITIIILSSFIFIKKIRFVSYINLVINPVLKRKKNITFSILLISIFKVLIHYFFYSYKRGRAKASFGRYLDEVFTDELSLFIPLTIVFLIVVWFFNDKIKAK